MVILLLAFIPHYWSSTSINHHATWYDVGSLATPVSSSAAPQGIAIPRDLPAAQPVTLSSPTPASVSSRSAVRALAAAISAGDFRLQATGQPEQTCANLNLHQPFSELHKIIK